MYKSLNAISKAVLAFLLVTIYSLLITIPNAYAAENFLTSYDTTYAVNEDGLTHVVMKVTLTNAASDYYYATSYKVKLGFEHLSNITASDTKGVITPQIEKTNDGYTIRLDFNDKVIGVGNKHTFTLSFNTPDIAQKVGQVWEINIPGIDDQKDIQSFDVDLQIPKSFGKPTYIKPTPADNKFHFTKEQLTKSGISLAFGNKQMYSFTLLYHLQNRNLFPIRTEIALPPYTNYQDILINSIEPTPVQVKVDQDGNWLAEYQLMPSEKIDVTVNGRATISLNPKKQSLTEEDLKYYIQDKPYWQASHEKIQALADTLKTPEAIYDYVVKTLKYDYSRVTNSDNRLGAVAVLQKPNTAVCLEFTDLFIAIARAAGIPAREVDGFAFTENPRQRPLSLVKDVLHAWPEYYDKDKQAWIMVDPTWSNTTGGVDYFNTLDFDHLVFVIKGISSSYPIPAGGYKIPGYEDVKDVHISSSEDEFVKDNELKVSYNIYDTYSAGLPIDGYVTVTNKGPAVSNGKTVTILADKLEPRKNTIAIGELLPYQNKKIPFHFNTQPFLTNKSYTITMVVEDNKYSKTIQIVPIYVQKWQIIGGVVGVLFTVIILIITIKTRRLRLL